MHELPRVNRQTKRLVSKKEHRLVIKHFEHLDISLHCPLLFVAGGRRAVQLGVQAGIALEIDDAADDVALRFQGWRSRAAGRASSCRGDDPPTAS